MLTFLSYTHKYFETRYRSGLYRDVFIFTDTESISTSPSDEDDETISIEVKAEDKETCDELTYYITQEIENTSVVSEDFDEDRWVNVIEISEAVFNNGYNCMCVKEDIEDALLNIFKNILNLPEYHVYLK